MEETGILFFWLLLISFNGSHVPKTVQSFEKLGVGRMQTVELHTSVYRNGHANRSAAVGGERMNNSVRFLS